MLRWPFPDRNTRPHGAPIAPRMTPLDGLRAVGQPSQRDQRRVGLRALATRTHKENQAERVTHLARSTKKLQVDDLVRVRESLPLAAFIGVGTVATEPVQKDRTWYYQIKFDVARCHDMTAAPHHIEMDKRVIGTRPLTQGETCSTDQRPPASSRRPQPLRSRLAMSF
jgi:hypothetical protein